MTGAPGAARRQPAEYARLRGMGVDDVRPLVAKNPEQRLEGERVAPGRNRAAEVRQHDQVHSAPSRALDEFAFRADGRPGDERGAISAQPVEALDGQQRVLLRAAEDQAGDDVHAADLPQGGSTFHRARTPDAATSPAASYSAGRENSSRARRNRDLRGVRNATIIRRLRSSTESRRHAGKLGWHSRVFLCLHRRTSRDSKSSSASGQARRAPSIGRSNSSPAASWRSSTSWLTPKENEKYLRHVRNEYKVLRCVQNSSNGAPPPGIVRVYGLIRTGFLRRHKEHLLVMQYIEGRDLKREGRYPTGQMVHILIGVCDALAALHRLGLIHGDMKPENIMVDPSGKPTLVDFGFSCKAGSRAQEHQGYARVHSARAGIWRSSDGKDGHLQLRGQHVFSLRRPASRPPIFPSPATTSHFIGPRSEETPSLRTFNPSIPWALDEIVLRCIRKDELGRPRVHRGGPNGPDRSGQEILRWLINPTSRSRTRPSREPRRSSPASNCSSASAAAAWAPCTAPSSSAWTASSR